MIFSAIAAMAANRVIGKANGLPWHLPEDLKFFKEMTHGKILIMGRKTFESLPKPFMSRYHIVVSRAHPEGVDSRFLDRPVFWVNSLDSALTKAEELVSSGQWPAEVFCAGGAEIYKQSLVRLDRLYLTKIAIEAEGDTFFPEFESSTDLQLVAQRTGQTQPSHEYCTYQRGQR